MELSVTSVVLFVSLIGFALAKVFNLRNSKYNPLWKLLIGVIAGIISYYSGLELRLLDSIILSTIASFSSDGVCDFIVMNKVKQSKDKMDKVD